MMPDLPTDRSKTGALSGGAAMPLGAASATAVVWCDRRTPEPRALLDGLITGGLHVIEVAGPFAAMAELSRLEHRRRTAVRRRATDAGAIVPPPAALILVEPGRLDGAGDVLGAAEVYAPSARVWWMDVTLGGEGQLRALRHVAGERLPWESGPSASQTAAQVPPMGVGRPEARGAEVVVRPGNGPTGVRAPFGGFGAGLVGMSAELPSRKNSARGEPSGPALRLSGGPANGSGGHPADPKAGLGGVSSGGSDRESGTRADERPQQLLSTEELRMLLE